MEVEARRSLSVIFFCIPATTVSSPVLLIILSPGKLRTAVARRPPHKGG